MRSPPEYQNVLKGTEHPFRWMYEKREPPPLTQVWIGAVDSRSDDLLASNSTQWLLANEQVAGTAEVFSIGSVLFIVYVPIIVTNEPNPGEPFSFGIVRPAADYFREIWPHKVAEVEWPPPRVYSVAELEREWPSDRRIRVTPEPRPQEPPP